MAETTNSSAAHLTLPPSRIARCSSRESFATDVSILSLSSFTSDLPPIRHNEQQSFPDREDLDLDLEKDNELARYREDMLEKMLESHSLSLPRMRLRNKSDVKTPSKFAETLSDTKMFTSILTISQEDLLKKCAEMDPKFRGSLYKSFSTSDVPFRSSFDNILSDSVINVKRATSQIWIPSDYVQILHCRKQHLKDLKDCNFDDFQYCKDYLTPTDTDSNPEISFTKQNAVKSGKNKGGEIFSSSSAPRTLSYFPDHQAALLSKRTPGVGLFLKKLKFSKEMGRRIRDDLLRKLTKRKQQNNVTKIDLDLEKGRPLSKYERNFMIFHWLQSLHEDSFDEP